MSFITILGIALGLAMDATAVSLAAGVTIARIRKRQIFRFAFHFGLFQALMPVIGWFLGASFDQYIRSWDHWIAFALLAAIGLKAIWDAAKGDEDEQNGDPTRGISLIVLSVATSIDAMAAGLSFAMLDVTIWYPAAVIGVVTAILSMLAMLLAKRIGMKASTFMKYAGGIVLLGIGVKIVLEHTLLA